MMCINHQSKDYINQPNYWTLHSCYKLIISFESVFDSFCFVLAGNFLAVGLYKKPMIEIWDLDVVCKLNCIFAYVCFSDQSRDLL